MLHCCKSAVVVVAAAVVAVADVEGLEVSVTSLPDDAAQPPGLANAGHRV